MLPLRIINGILTVLIISLIIYMLIFWPETLIGILITFLMAGIFLFLMGGIIYLCIYIDEIHKRGKKLYYKKKITDVK